jgi:hypothetical protein
MARPDARDGANQILQTVFQHQVFDKADNDGASPAGEGSHGARRKLVSPLPTDNRSPDRAEARVAAVGVARKRRREVPRVRGRRTRVF